MRGGREAGQKAFHCPGERRPGREVVAAGWSRDAGCVNHSSDRRPGCFQVQGWSPGWWGAAAQLRFALSQNHALFCLVGSGSLAVTLSSCPASWLLDGHSHRGGVRGEAKVTRCSWGFTCSACLFCYQLLLLCEVPAPPGWPCLWGTVTP